MVYVRLGIPCLKHTLRSLARRPFDGSSPIYNRRTLPYIRVDSSMDHPTVTTPYRTETSSRTHRIAGVVAAMVLAIASLSGCTESTLAPLPLQITVAANRTTATPGDTVYFVAAVQASEGEQR